MDLADTASLRFFYCAISTFKQPKNWGEAVVFPRPCQTSRKNKTGCNPFKIDADGTQILEVSHSYRIGDTLD